jgi:hypothetical protein
MYYTKIYFRIIKLPMHRPVRFVPQHSTLLLSSLPNFTSLHPLATTQWGRSLKNVKKKLEKSLRKVLKFRKNMEKIWKKKKNIILKLFRFCD